MCSTYAVHVLHTSVHSVVRWRVIWKALICATIFILLLPRLMIIIIVTRNISWAILLQLFPNSFITKSCCVELEFWMNCTFKDTFSGQLGMKVKMLFWCCHRHSSCLGANIKINNRKHKTIFFLSCFSYGYHHTVHHFVDSKTDVMCSFLNSNIL